MLEERVVGKNFYWICVWRNDTLNPICGPTLQFAIEIVMIVFECTVNSRMLKVYAIWMHINSCFYLHIVSTLHNKAQLPNPIILTLFFGILFQSSVLKSKRPNTSWEPIIEKSTQAKPKISKPISLIVFPNVYRMLQNSILIQTSLLVQANIFHQTTSRAC